MYGFEGDAIFMLCGIVGDPGGQDAMDIADMNVLACQGRELECLLHDVLGKHQVLHLDAVHLGDCSLLGGGLVVIDKLYNS